MQIEDVGQIEVVEQIGDVVVDRIEVVNQIEDIVVDHIENTVVAQIEDTNVDQIENIVVKQIEQTVVEQTRNTSIMFPPNKEDDKYNAYYATQTMACIEDTKKLALLLPKIKINNKDLIIISLLEHICNSYGKSYHTQQQIFDFMLNNGIIHDPQTVLPEFSHVRLLCTQLIDVLMNNIGDVDTNNSSGDNSSGDNGGGDNSSGDNSSGDNSSGDNSSGDSNNGSNNDSDNKNTANYNTNVSTPHQTNNNMYSTEIDKYIDWKEDSDYNSNDLWSDHSHSSNDANSLNSSSDANNLNSSSDANSLNSSSDVNSLNSSSDVNSLNRSGTSGFFEYQSLSIVPYERIRKGNDIQYHPTSSKTPLTIPSTPLTIPSTPLTTPAIITTPSYLSYYSRYKMDFIEIGSVGKGGFGTVYKSYNKLDQQMYAIKKIKIKVLSENNTCYLNEILFMSRLYHANIVRYFNSWIELPTLYIQMELCAQSLQTYILDRNYNTSTITNIEHKMFYQIVSAVCYLHSHHLVHGDLNPHNIFLTDTLDIKIGDFGLTKIADDDVLTSDGNKLYMSPEQLKDKICTHKSDIFSIGLIYVFLHVCCGTFMEQYELYDNIRSIHSIDDVNDIMQLNSINKELLYGMCNPIAHKRYDLEHVLKNIEQP